MPRILTTALLVLSASFKTAAFPFLKQVFDSAGYVGLVARQCEEYCGDNNAYCCGSGTICYTAEDQVAGCSTPPGALYGVYTTTWTETRTYTSTVTPAGPAVTTGTCTPEAGSGEISCGWVCCGSWQYCAYTGQCLDNPGYTGTAGGETGTTYVITTNGVVTTQFSAPYRVTSATITGVFTTATSTSTNTAVPVTSSGTGSSLSGGAIAGIVIGTLVGISLLLLLCFCCIARGLWNAIFGRRRRRERESVVVEERYSRHGSRVPSAHPRRGEHGSWYGSDEARRRPKEKSSGAKWLGIAAAAGTLLALLNLRGDKKRRPPPRRPRTVRSESYYSDYGTSPSSISSGQRTHNTRRSHQTRTTRASRPSRRN